MLEVLIYIVAALGGLVITGFSVHMLIGGLVSVELENQLIAAVCVLVAGVIAYMVWDVLKARRK